MGNTISNKVASIVGFGCVVFDRGSPSNVLSLTKMEKKYRIIFDSWNGNQFIMHKPGRKMVIFNQHPCGLCYHDTDSKKDNVPSYDGMAVRNIYDKGVSFVTTVKENMRLFTHRKIKCTKDTRSAYDIVGTPSPKYFKNMVRGQLTNNYISPTKTS